MNPQNSLVNQPVVQPAQPLPPPSKIITRFIANLRADGDSCVKIIEFANFVANSSFVLYRWTL